MVAPPIKQQKVYTGKKSTNLVLITKSNLLWWQWGLQLFALKEYCPSCQPFLGKTNDETRMRWISENPTRHQLEKLRDKDLGKVAGEGR